MLAAAALLLLIALPMVNGRRSNALRIEELDEELSAKDYYQGKIDNRMNQATNAYSSYLRTIKNKKGNFSVREVCTILSEAVKKCKKGDKRGMCQSHSDCWCSERDGDCPGCQLQEHAGRLAL